MDVTPHVLFEDNHLLVINKPAGVLVQGDATGDQPLVETAKAYVGRKYNKPGAVFLGVVHRLDRPVSGVVVFARTSKALARMNELFRDKKTIKTYVAVVGQVPSRPEDHLVHWLSKDEVRNKTTAFAKDTPGALRSELRYSVKATSGSLSLLEVLPVTGRPHQIRVQLASIGCVIEGDIKYGALSPLSDASIALHARRLEFVHPVTGANMKFEAPVPEIFPWRSFDLTRGLF